MAILLLWILPLLLVVDPAFACRGPETEKAQERDASILFEGTVKDYELSKAGSMPGITSGSLAKVKFQVNKTLRGPEAKQRWVVMRGHQLPKSLEEFQKRFGRAMTVGVRDFGKRINQKDLPDGYQNLLFVVDAVCSMNGEDWYLRPIKKN